MTITDACPCGAKFSMVTGTAFASARVDSDDARLQHDRWLNAHEMCRKANIEIALRTHEQDES